MFPLPLLVSNHPPYILFPILPPSAAGHAGEGGINRGTDFRTGIRRDMNRERDRQEGSAKPGGSMCVHFHSSDAESKERKGGRREGGRERGKEAGQEPFYPRPALAAATATVVLVARARAAAAVCV